jgi:hypothetical protein
LPQTSHRLASCRQDPTPYSGVLAAGVAFSLGAARGQNVCGAVACARQARLRRTRARRTPGSRSLARCQRSRMRTSPRVIWPHSRQARRCGSARRTVRPYRSMTVPPPGIYDDALEARLAEGAESTRTSRRYAQSVAKPLRPAVTTWVLACGHEIPREPPTDGAALRFPSGLVRCAVCHRPQVVTAASIRIPNPDRR